MEPDPKRFPPFLQGVAVLVVAVLVLAALAIGAVQSSRAARVAESNREVLAAVAEVLAEIRVQAAISACVLLIEPAERTPENVAACRP